MNLFNISFFKLIHPFSFGISITGFIFNVLLLKEK